MLSYRDCERGRLATSINSKINLKPYKIVLVLTFSMFNPPKTSKPPQSVICSEVHVSLKALWKKGSFNPKAKILCWISWVWFCQISVRDSCWTCDKLRALSSWEVFQISFYCVFVLLCKHIPAISAVIWEVGMSLIGTFLATAWEMIFSFSIITRLPWAGQGRGRGG